MYECSKCYGTGRLGFIKKEPLLCPKCLGTGVRRQDILKFKEHEIIEMQETKHDTKESEHTGEEVQGKTDLS